MTVEQLESEVLKLPAEVRARLAEKLLVSLETEDERTNDLLWAREAERRLREIQSGADETDFLLSNPENRKRLLNALENVKQGKTVEVNLDEILRQCGE